MNLSDSFFNKIEKKTNVNKDTIMSLAQKLQQNDLKNEDAWEDALKNIIGEGDYNIFCYDTKIRVEFEVS